MISGEPAFTTSPGSAVRVTTVPSNGARTCKSLRFACASSSLRASLCSLRFAARDLRLLLRDLLPDHAALRRDDLRINQRAFA